MERKYAELYKPLDKIRFELVTGEKEPLADQLVKAEEYKTPIPTKEKPQIDIEEVKKSKGLPGFWLKAMQNNPEIAPKIMPADIPILNHLTNVHEELLEGNVLTMFYCF